MGVSVIQLVQTFGKVTGMTVAYELKPRREGDISAMYSNGERAKTELGWTPRFTLEQMCKYDYEIDKSLAISHLFFCYFYPSQYSLSCCDVVNSQTLPLTGQLRMFLKIFLWFKINI